MAGYIGSKTSVTVTSPETDSRYVSTTGDTISGSLTVTGTINGRNTSTDGAAIDGLATNYIATGGLKTVGSNSLEGSGDIAFRSVNGISVVGSGDISAGASTTYGAVGTYIMGACQSKPVEGSTYSGSSIRPAGFSANGTFLSDNYVTPRMSSGSSGLSGTWRSMGRYQAASGSPTTNITIYVRIS